MTDNELNMKLAILCGLKEVGMMGPAPFFVDEGIFKEVPDYCNDLNAIRETILSLKPTMHSSFSLCLIDILDLDHGPWHVPETAAWLITTASARTLAEAFFLAHQPN